jgi:type IV secretion system protein VirB9
MIRLTLALLATSVAAGPALAGDARLVSHRYNPNEVVRIQGQHNVQASVAFGEDEHIENVAVGDSASWQITPNKRANLLFVKPLAPRARTNMTVVTDRHTYFFDLVAGPAATPLYVLRFTYPDEPKPAKTQQAGADGLTPEEKLAAVVPPAEIPDPATLNFAWRQRGDKELLPSRIYDDGNSTYLTWPAKTSLPAIQIKNEKGVEGPVNFAVRGDVIVVDGVPAILVLRAGKDSATLEHQGAPRKAVAPAALAAVSVPQTATAASMDGK